MTKSNSKTGDNTPEDTPKGGRRPPWKPGQSGNPDGRPKGSRNKATLAALALLDGESEALTRKAVDLALEGDTTALRLCLERIAPPRKDVPVSFALPKMKNAGDALAAINSIVQAVANGELTPGEATSLAKLIETFRRTAETQDLERRITELEKTK
jgi:hypothetical protein